MTETAVENTPATPGEQNSAPGEMKDTAEQETLSTAAKAADSERIADGAQLTEEGDSETEAEMPTSLSVKESGSTSKLDVEPNTSIHTLEQSTGEEEGANTKPTMERSTKDQESSPETGKLSSSGAKAVIRREMAALRGSILVTPGAVSVTSTADGPRAERLERKGRSQQKVPSPSFQATSTTDEPEPFVRQAPASSAVATLKQPPSYSSKDITESITSIRSRARQSAERTKSRSPKRVPPSSAVASAATLRREEPASAVGAFRSESASEPLPRATKTSNQKFQEVARMNGLEEGSSTSLKSLSASQAGSRAMSSKMDRLDEEQAVNAEIVDEEALEKEVTAKIIENTVAAEIVTSEEFKAAARIAMWKIVLVFVVILGAILAIVLPLVIQKSDPVPTPSPTEAPTAQPEIDFLYDIIAEVSDEALLQEEGTPQYNAFNWIAYDDTGIDDVKSVDTRVIIERYVLAVFYYSTGGGNWTDQYQFLSSSSVCLWQTDFAGASCDSTNAFVSRLIFNSNNLEGTLPTEVGELTGMVQLQAVVGSLEGTLPSEIGNLVDLKVLQISSQKISGTVPSTLGSIAGFLAINLSANSLTGSLPAALFENNRQWQYVDFRGNALNGTLPAIARSSAVQFLLMADNDFDGIIPESFFEQGSLATLELSNNRLSGTLPNNLAGASGLNTLLLDANAITGTIPPGIQSLQDLEVLDLSGNNMTGTIPTSLQDLDRLTSIDLSSNWLGGTIPKELAALQDLVAMDLSSNELTGSVPSTLGGIPTLEILDLSATAVSSGLESSFCAMESLITSITSDCGGDPADVECSCCATCCNDLDDSCVPSVDRICEINADRFELQPNKDAVCNCTETGAELSCTDTACVSCNSDESICAQSSDYGYTFDQVTGEIVDFENTIQYVTGRDETLLYRNNIQAGGQCEVFVNGEACELCQKSTCNDGRTGFYIQCSNLEDGYVYDFCTDTDKGYLIAFDFISSQFCPLTIV